MFPWVIFFPPGHLFTNLDRREELLFAPVLASSTRFQRYLFTRTLASRHVAYRYGISKEARCYNRISPQYYSYVRSVRLVGIPVILPYIIDVDAAIEYI